MIDNPAAREAMVRLAAEQSQRLELPEGVGVIVIMHDRLTGANGYVATLTNERVYDVLSSLTTRMAQ